MLLDGLGLDPTAAQAVMTRTVHGLLKDFAPDPARGRT
jgi:hypothetical protein